MKRTLVITIIYFLVAEISIALSINNASTAIVWPAAGVAFAMVLRFEAAIWPAIFIGSFLANMHFLKDYDPSFSAWVTANMGISIGNVLAPIVGMRLISFQSNFRPHFSRHKDVLTFTLLGAAPTAMIAALGGALSIHGAGLGGSSQLLVDWQQWGISDLVGALIVAPAFLLWLQDPSIRFEPKKAFEAASITIAIVFIGYAVFGPLNDQLKHALARPFLLILPLIWAAVRFSPRSTATWNLIAFMIVWLGTSYGYGQYNRESLSEPMAPVQLFLGIVGFTILLLCAFVQELKQARFDLLEANASLEQRVLERTHKLAENETCLRVAKEKAEKATELKDKFVSLVSHDLRAPLGSIASILEILENPEENQIDENEIREMTHSAKELAERQLKMVGALLDTSRLQIGEIILVKTSIDLREFAAKQTDNYTFMAERKGIELANELPIGMSIQEDEALLGEVFQNLLSNAIKFCGSGDKITIYKVKGAESTIAIKDTGSGIPVRLIPQLFNYELKTTSRGTNGEKGSGLGLPYCKDIMEAMGGSLSVESVECEGSVFFIHFGAGAAGGETALKKDPHKIEGSLQQLPISSNQKSLN